MDTAWRVALLAIVVTVELASTSGGLSAQQPPDTTQAPMLEQTVTVADRAESQVGSSVGAVQRVTIEQLTRLPTASLAEALRLVPGFAVAHLDGLGHDPQTTVRGFYAAGETGYLKVMLDGKPLNAPESGSMIWDLVPTVAISAIEVVRGPSSSLYGDGAVAGVINLISADGAPVTGVWDLSGGTPFTLGGGLRGQGDLAYLPVTFFVGVRRIGGYRDNATRTVGNVGATLDLTSREDRSLSLSALGMWQDYEIPGPRPEDEIATNPEPIEVYYSYDGRFTWLGRTDLEGSLDLSEAARVAAKVSTEIRRRTEISTLQTGVDIGDTEERSIDTERLSGSISFEQRDLTPWSDRLTIGADASTGRFGLQHRDVVSGGAVTYFFSDPTRPVFATRSGSRNEAAFFGQYEVRPADALRLSLSGRFDWLGDASEAGDPNPGVKVNASHTAFSPKAGINLRWIESDGQTGHLYATASRTFRAPTPDQLFDQRVVPLRPSVDVEISNPLLEPERGTNLEAGLYHDVVVSPGSWSVGGSLAVYQMDMEDEIAVDLSTFLYGNIAESRHRGVEAGVTVHGPATSTFFANYALQEVTARSGTDAGNALQLIPRHTLSAGLSRGFLGNLDVGVYVTRHGSAWLDAANTRELEAFMRVDARATVLAGDVEVSLSARNLLNRSYSTTGVLLPGVAGTALLYPASGSALELGVHIGG